MTEDNNNNYRYCFECEKWLKKEEVNEVDWGPQPGGEMGKCWHCSTCRKQLGDDSQTQIFRCEKHPNEILKVWGVLDGENKQKVFYEKCPQENQNEQESSFWDKLPVSMPVAIGSVVAFLLGLLAVAKIWWSKKSKSLKDNLQTMQDNISKEKKSDEEEIEVD